MFHGRYLFGLRLCPSERCLSCLFRRRRLFRRCLLLRLQRRRGLGSGAARGLGLGQQGPLLRRRRLGSRLRRREQPRAFQRLFVRCSDGRLVTRCEQPCVCSLLWTCTSACAICVYVCVRVCV